MIRTKGLYRGKIFGKRLWKMVYTVGPDRKKKPADYYIGETKLPRWLGKILWNLYFWRNKKK